MIVERTDKEIVPEPEIYQLSAKQTIKQILLKSESLNSKEIEELIQKLIEKNSQQQKVKSFNFQKFLLSGPVMDDSQYQDYLEHKKHFNTWRVK
jgi:formate dehydrogenase maturation protein FdhE